MFKTFVSLLSGHASYYATNPTDVPFLITAYLSPRIKVQETGTTALDN